jgi:hypothetical protein
MTSIADSITQPGPDGRPTQATRASLALRCGQELGLLALLYLGYVLARSAMSVKVVDAHRRGWQILHLEQVLHLDVERHLNALAIGIPVVGLSFAYLYATLHYLVTPAVMFWIAVRRRDGYRRARTSLLAATALGLLCYWLLPAAPPRLLDAGFTDVMASFSSVGWWGEAASAPRGLEGLSNQFAAFPSLHVGWAMWVALTLRANVRRRDVRRCAWAYPILMGIVVMATANHYLIDALAGVACVCAGHRFAVHWNAAGPDDPAPATACVRRTRP